MPGVGRPPPLRDVVEAARLAALQSYITPKAAATEPFITLVRMAAHLLQAPIAMITLIGRDQQWIKAAYGTDLQQLPRAFALCNHAIAEPSSATVVADTLVDPRFQNHPLVLAPPHVRFYAGVCLVDSDGYALGTLCVMDDKPSSIGPDALALLHKMADETVDALVRQRAEQTAQQDNAVAISPCSPWPDEHPQDEHWNSRSWTGRASSGEPALRPGLDPPPSRPLVAGWLGVRTEHTPVPGSDREGRLLLSVAADSPAERADLRAGDVILSINGRAARRRNDITAAMASCPLGGVMRLRVWRTGKVIERDIRLELMPKERLLHRRAS